MDYAQIIDRIRERSGFETDEDAARAMRATLNVLGRSIPEDDKELLFRDLPEEITTALANARYDRTRGLEAIGRLVSRKGNNTSLGVALEHVQVVCEVLSEVMGEDARKLLPKHLPLEVAELFRARPDRPQTEEPHGIQGPAQQKGAA
jgi:uncharacterized protein (DUF2267 family)